MNKYIIKFWKKGEEKDDCLLRQEVFDNPEDLFDYVTSHLNDIIIKEEWKNIPTYEGVYKISNLGRVKSYSKKSKGKILTPNMNKVGYLKIELHDNKHKNKRYKKEDGKYLKNNRKNFFVHVLVAENFCPNPYPDKYDEVDHIGRIRDEPSFWSLRWIDPEGNRENRDFTRHDKADYEEEPKYIF